MVVCCDTVYSDILTLSGEGVSIVPRRYFCGGSWCLKFVVLWAPYVFFAYFS